MKLRLLQLVSVYMLSCFSISESFVTTWTVAHQASLSMGSPRQEYGNGLPCPPPGNLCDPGIKSVSLMSPVLAGGFFTTSATWETPQLIRTECKFMLRSSGLPRTCVHSKQLQDTMRWKSTLKYWLRSSFDTMRQCRCFWKVSGHFMASNSLPCPHLTATWESEELTFFSRNISGVLWVLRFFICLW